VSLALDAISGAAIGLSLSVWPGQGLSRSVRGAVRGGVAGGLAAASGWMAANLLIVFGIGALLLREPVSAWVHSPAARLAEVLSGVVLVVLGWRLMEDRTPAALHRDRAEDHLRPWSVSPFLDCFVATIFASHWLVLWWLAGAGILLGPARDEWRGVSSFALGLCLAGLLVKWGIAVSLAAPGREWAWSDRVFRIVTALSGMVIALLGFLVAVPPARQSFVRDLLARIVESVFRQGG
jgi:threonine/homoserine/homoserine lactone efflux protein